MKGENGGDENNDDNSSRKHSKKKSRGMNKGKDRAVAVPRDHIRVCYQFATEGSCPYGDECKYPHDLAAFSEGKGPDIGPICHNFRTFGKCRFGIRCRFAKDHMTEDFKDIVNEEKVIEVGSSLNIINAFSKTDLEKVKKGKLSLLGSSDAMKWSDLHKEWIQTKDKMERAIIKELFQKNLSDSTDTADSNHSTPAFATAVNEEAASKVESEQKPPLVDIDLSDHDALLKSKGFEAVSQQLKDEYNLKKEQYDMDTKAFLLRAPEKKKIDFRGKTYLAPLTTVGNLPFRRVAKSFGVDITCGEMAVTSHLLSGQMNEWALVRRHPCEDIFGVQISASTVPLAVRACESIAAMCSDENGINTGVDFVDLNCGCPVELVTKLGAGSALLERRNRLQQMVFGMNRVLNAPVTVKLRTGVMQDRRVAHKIVPMMKEAGVAAITLHGRSKEQRYSKFADWEYINECAGIAGDIPFFGNGDVLSHEDYYEHLEKHKNVSGIMIGRGALVKPWIFNEIKERRVWDIRSSERLDILKQFGNYGLEHWGSDTQGVNMTRRYMCEWLSFLYRYIPVGLLEVLPQKLNERPPPFYGRDDLETLMGSPVVTDWVKITEMILVC
jgi:tRNA-dihydrouridine synthase 3